MEDGVKEDTAKPKEVKFTDKAGWVKKSTGRFLGIYKDRYIELGKTEIVVYENEDLQKCIERVDLENYDKCLELRSAFKKKNRLVLIRAPKSGNKVQDVKLQAQSAEEKEAWIKALRDGINRAKNKIFDEVKVDESCSLDHVTRSRPKGNRSRRPPTRIHVVANISLDGIVRQDTVDNMPNGTHSVNTDVNEPKEAVKPMPPSKTSDIPEEEPANDESLAQKKILKPPMPPSKASKSPAEEPASEESPPQKKVLKPPMPPSKEHKPSAPAAEDTTGESVSDSRVESGAPPTPSKPSTSQDESSSTDLSPPTEDPQPPTPPSKENKPSLAAVAVSEVTETPGEVDGATDDKEEEEDGNPEDIAAEADSTTSAPKKALKPVGVMWDSPVTESDETPTEEETLGLTTPSSDKSMTSSGDVMVPDAEPVKPTVQLATVTVPTPVKKGPGPPAPPKKKPVKLPVKVEDSAEQCSAKNEPTRVTDSPPSGSGSALAKAVSEGPSEAKDDTKLTPEPKTEHQVVVLSLSNPGESVMPCRLSVGGKEQEEEKSIDSGQHSAEESESGDQATSPSTGPRCSRSGLDGETSKDDTEPTDSQAQGADEGPPPPPTQENCTGLCSALSLQPAQTGKCTPQSSRPPVPFKPSSKARSASMGDLLSEPLESRAQPIMGLPVTCPGDNMNDLQSKVTLELEKTEELLDTMATGPNAEAEQSSPCEGEVRREPTTEVLLTAMETLRKADQLLKKAKSFKERKQSDINSKRTSW